MGDQCTEFLDQLEAFLDQECSRDVRDKIQRHLQDCPPCGHRADFEERLRRIIASSCRDAAPADLTESILTRLQLR